MRYLLHSLVQIALLRKDPSVLPASIVLVVLTAVGYGAANVLNGWISYGRNGMYARGATDVALALAFFWLLLALSGRLERYRQTISAALGAYIVMSPLVALVLMMRWTAQTNQAVMVFMLVGSAVIVSWYALVVGQILRSAIDVGFVTSIALALSWQLAGFALHRLIPVVV